MRKPSVGAITKGLVIALVVEVALFALSAVFPPDMTRAKHSSPVTLDRRGAWLRAMPVDRDRDGDHRIGYDVPQLRS